MTKKLKFFIILAGTFSISNHYSYANQKYIELAGNYIKTNSELLSKSINAVENKLVNNEDVVTNVLYILFLRKSVSSLCKFTFR